MGLQMQNLRPYQELPRPMEKTHQLNVMIKERRLVPDMCSLLDGIAALCHLDIPYYASMLREM